MPRKNNKKACFPVEAGLFSCAREKLLCIESIAPLQRSNRVAGQSKNKLSSTALAAKIPCGSLIDEHQDIISLRIHEGYCFDSGTYGLGG